MNGLATAVVAGYPLFSWSAVMLLAIIGAQMFILHQHRRQLGLFGRKIGYYERLSSFYRFVMRQQGVDVDEYVPREDGHERQTQQGRDSGPNRHW